LLTRQKAQNEVKFREPEVDAEAKSAASCIHFLNEAGFPIENLAELVQTKQIRTAQDLLSEVIQNPHLYLEPRSLT